MKNTEGLAIRPLKPGAFKLTHDGRPLFAYVWRPEIPLKYSPRPYFHPIWTLGGEVVTDSAPEDHPWHQGLSMTCANVSGYNIWGGPTYVHGRGYVELPNNGRALHRSWERFRCSREEFSACQILDWVDPDGRALLRERRTATVISSLIHDDSWVLQLGIRLVNVSPSGLEFGSPTTAGRPDAGYGGLFWRGARRFTNSTVLTPLEDLEDPMGRSAPWLALRTSQDQRRGPVTMLFVDHPDNPRYPNKWFVRTEEYPGVSFSFMFDEPYRLDPGADVTLRYQLLMGDGAWAIDELRERGESLQVDDHDLAL